MISESDGSAKAKAHTSGTDFAPTAYTSSRRGIVRDVLLAIGFAGTTLPAWGSLLATEGRTTPFIGTSRFEVLDAVAETIVPRTDTPGARDALVPARYDALMKNWASAQTVADFQRVLDEIDLAARMRDPKGISALPAVQQFEVVSTFDKARSADRAYLKFKGVILALYYLSEAGATQELRYEHVPGDWEPSIPVTTETRAYAIDVSI